MARSRGRIGGTTSVKAKYAFGTDEEIAHRDQTTYPNPPTRFGQIGPGDTGRNLNEPDGERQRISGDAHFTKLP